MKKSIYLILLLVGCAFIGCEKDYATLEISAPDKIVMEVGDSLLLHWKGNNRPVSKITTSVYRYITWYGGDWSDVPDSAICYVKNIVINGVEIFDGDVYLYAQRPGRDTLRAEMMHNGHFIDPTYYYPILVVDK